MHVPHNPSRSVRDSVCGCIQKNISAPVDNYTKPSDASPAPAFPLLALRRGDGSLCFNVGGSDVGGIGPAGRGSSPPAAAAPDSDDASDASDADAAAAAAAAAAAFFGGGELLLADGGDFRL